MINSLKSRKSIRLKNYDYSQDGFYFVTIGVKNKANMFGDIKNGKIILSDIGIMCNRLWYDIPNHFPFVILDQFIIMPNHIHCIIEIRRDSIYAVRPDPDRPDIMKSH